VTRTTASTTPHVNGVLVVVRVLLVERHFACLAQLIQKPSIVRALKFELYHDCSSLSRKDSFVAGRHLP